MPVTEAPHETAPLGETPQEETPTQKSHARVLRIVAALNTVMFAVEGSLGFVAGSSAMKADSADMFGDALGSITGLAVRKSSLRKQAIAALVKAGIMGAVGLGIIGGAIAAIISPALPALGLMAVVGGLALCSNTACALLLYKHRNDNINMKSTWKCTRNDLFSNIGVLGAAGLGHLLLSPVPDIVVGVLVSTLFVKSAVDVAREAAHILREEKKKDKEKESGKPAAAPRPQPEKPRPFRRLRALFNRNAAITAVNENTAPANASAPENKTAQKPASAPEAEAAPEPEPAYAQQQAQAPRPS